MRKNLPVTNNEVKLDGDSCILSTTNLKGQITYINKDFVDISGFEKDELIGEPHNLVRHPDMPSAAFDDMWQHLKSGQSWMGMVKNRCKNGDFYWVNAYATPISENGATKEYQSIRTKARPDDIKRAKEVYAQLNDSKPVRALKTQVGIKTQLLITMAAALTPLFISAIAQTGIAGITAATLASIAIGFGGIHYFTRTMTKAAKEARSIVHHPMMQYIYTGDTSEAGQILFAVRKVSTELKAIVGRLNDSSEQLGEMARSLDNDIALTEKGVSHQESEVESTATAVNELSASAHEVSQNASLAAEATETANEETATSGKVVNETITLISELAGEVENASDIIHKLNEDSNEIGSVLEVIKSIADQTNLLALNAAIEAARAGDQGRGFAVVADEVRTLASRTAASTEEIQLIIEQIQSGANKAVVAMETSQEKAKNGVEQVGKAGESLTSISSAVRTITEMNMQIATAAKEQSAVVEDINERVSTIQEVNELTVDSMHSTQQSSRELSELAYNLRELAGQFWHK